MPRKKRFYVPFLYLALSLSFMLGCASRFLRYADKDRLDTDQEFSKQLKIQDSEAGTGAGAAPPGTAPPGAAPPAGGGPSTGGTGTKKGEPEAFYKLDKMLIPDQPRKSRKQKKKVKQVEKKT